MSISTFLSKIRTKYHSIAWLAWGVLCNERNSYEPLSLLDDIASSYRFITINDAPEHGPVALHVCRASVQEHATDS